MGYTNEQIAELSGVPLGTVQKVFGGKTCSPRYQTLRKLEAVFNSKESPQTISGDINNYDFQSAGLLRDAAADHYGESIRCLAECEEENKRHPYSSSVEKILQDAVPGKACNLWNQKQGGYTLEDYYALPDDVRVELIDGVFFVMEGPSLLHQAIIGSLYFHFESFVRSGKGSCKVILSPFDVQLDKDNRTMVEPDLTVICQRERITMKCGYGAPDFVLEVLSPST